MNIKKLIPWNWFKKEEENNVRVSPVKRGSAQETAGLPVDPRHQFYDEIDRLFDRVFQGFGIAPSVFGSSLLPRFSDAVFKPTLDLSVTDKEYTITVEIPGVDEKDVHLEIANDTLTIRGEKNQTKEEKEKDYYRMERTYGSFQRILSLPEDTDHEGVKASFKNGVLTVTLPRKSVPESKTRQIKVETA